MRACLAVDGAVAEFLAELPLEIAEGLLGDWAVWARRQQLPPRGSWTTWLILGGRGAGKTRAGAEWVRGMVAGRAPFATQPAGRIALVGETFADAREVMVEGVSGILAISPRRERPAWQPSRRRLEWPNGAVAQLFSAADPESLRGPQFDAAWADELAKWPAAEATWDMLQFGLRLGDRPRQVVTTTPRAVPLLKRILGDKRTAVSRMTTAENRGNLAPGFLKAVVERYRGTRLGRQELDGELIEDRDDALWARASIDRDRVAQAPEMMRVVVAVDPPATSHAKSDACGIVAAGIGVDQRAYVLADRTVYRASPQVWAERAVRLYHLTEADRLVVEVNQGGDMVATVVAQVDPSVPVTPVRATRGKWLRAEPVAQLYEQGRVSHVGPMAELEDQMCNFVPAGTSGGASPDRIDALVWALTVLMLCPDAPTSVPRVRRFG
ncbi:ATP-binding protein [Acuticoccus sediminis]|uniref:ATP-binding protein n=1 Tax=Acuticoccus sediminis TaxID=2184697 RepID=A0A8B2NQ34_9HYPH|nr:ATP-binding protein [Acuticoccus sediminis]